MDNIKLIGFTLVNRNLRKAFEQIAFDGPPGKPYKEYEGVEIHVEVYTHVHALTKAAGVQHWFAPVYARAEHALPKSVDEIKGRTYYMSGDGSVRFDNFRHGYKNTLSSKQRAEAFLALMQLVELRDAWNGDWKADWDARDEKHFITTYKGIIVRDSTSYYQETLAFKSEDLRDKFLEQFKELIETAKELI